jgi:hypothetical protein
MEADAHFVMGTSHGVCQDYALAGLAGTRWIALVCDGCSSSPDTDFGSRVLARAFLAALLREVPAVEAIDQALETAHTIAEQLRLPEDALDTTLCGWLVNAGTAHGFIHGDGVLAIRSAAGLEVHHATQPANAPDYPSYRMNVGRALAHHQAFGADTFIAVSGSNPKTVTVKGGYRLEIPLAGIHALAAFSDGVNTVTNGTRALPQSEAIEALTTFPQPTGAFFSRRLRRQTRQWAKTGFAPTDDLAGAVLVP